jgi:UV radiation resistance-associated gene protein
LSTNTSAIPPLVRSNPTLIQRRLRHIEYVQVRNLTPFPVRDAFASALTQPSARPQFNAHGNLSDDLDITIGRRQGRRVSTTSTHTSKSIKSDADDGPPLTPSQSGRKRSSSKASSQVEPQSPLVGGSVRRISQRSRHVPHPSSIGSSSNVRRREATAGSSTTTTTAASSVSRVFSDLSQTGLETVVNSRLVETFITVSVPGVPIEDLHNSPAKRSPHTPPTSPVKQSPSIPPQSIHRRGPSINGSRSTSRASTVSKGPTPTKRLPAGRHGAPMLASPKTSHGSTISLSHPFPSTFSSEYTLKYPSVPNFISPIHRPSINPTFALEDLSTPGIVDWTDLSIQKMKVELWGRVGTGWGVTATVKGKGKGKESTPSSDEWKTLETWEIDLTGLVPLPEHVSLPVFLEPI